MKKRAEILTTYNEKSVQRAWIRSFIIMGVLLTLYFIPGLLESYKETILKVFKMAVILYLIALLIDFINSPRLIVFEGGVIEYEKIKSINKSFTWDKVQEVGVLMICGKDFKKKITRKIMYVYLSLDKGVDYSIPHKSLYTLLMDDNISLFYLNKKNYLKFRKFYKERIIGIEKYEETTNFEQEPLEF